MREDIQSALAYSLTLAHAFSSFLDIFKLHATSQRRKVSKPFFPPKWLKECVSQITQAEF